MKRFIICCSVLLMPAELQAQGNVFNSPNAYPYNYNKTPKGNNNFGKQTNDTQASAATIYGGAGNPSQPLGAATSSQYLQYKAPAPQPKASGNNPYLSLNQTTPRMAKPSGKPVLPPTKPKVPAKLKSTMIPYVAALSYDKGSSRNAGLSAGVYVSVPTKESMVEMDVSLSGIDYKADTTKDLKQANFAIAYTKYISNQANLRGGVHYINSSDSSTNNGMVFFGGGKIYDDNNWHIGSEFYYSRYSRFQPKALNVGQATVEAGFGGGRFYKEGSVYFTAKANYIHPMDADDFNMQDHYLSAGLDINYSIPYWKYELGGWIGEESMAVHKGGMVVLNLQDEHNGNIHTGVQRYLNDDIFVKAGYSLDFFQDKTTTADTKRHVGVLSVGGHF
ncbi:MAG: hypothetical protein HQL69_21725 [Magnetococcales bacterium]|nr:hypothetical protein [Magnetococcales bacterium]